MNVTEDIKNQANQFQASSTRNALPTTGVIQPTTGVIQPAIVVVQNSPIIFKRNLALPFDVENDLNNFSQVFIAKELDIFRSMHCFDGLKKDYIIYGQLPDGDKKILFTSREHFQWCHCCDDCTITCCLCEYICCDRIIFQMDYKRNGANFYTQGFNIQKGCYFCKCYCCHSLCRRA